MKKEITHATNVMFDTIVDALLYVSINAIQTAGVRSISQMNYRDYETDVLLCRYNSQTIRKAIQNCIARNQLRRTRAPTGRSLEITDIGRKRIQEKIPTYKEKRPWDGYLYLVSYDVPIKANAKRDILREYLKKIGCGKLQDSLWMTPYNPTGIIDAFVDEEDIPGTILVSKLGKDGSIGDEDRQTLIERIYGYKKLNERYEEFINQYTNKNAVSKTQLSLDYHIILRDDPQLPFALEPSGFQASSAHKLFVSRILS